ncbi:uncharacterized protein TRIADDRAFT_53510 [Trichoplax adhaerens]|uniref:Uncharacterized protein n=1 Tax=Trichoplax adhaerens TaxID=10228 RepID=B3RPE9_TRIAD|nr:predicted protein [Trichoplax adhaerens]EDV27622.1 predicted protein [Trichoplax adhaerens]|eukprot:XP_002109456.1 predicted protein [Trichoplax adhaerens]
MDSDAKHTYATPTHQYDLARLSRTDLNSDNARVLRKSMRTSMMMKIALLIYAIAITVVAIVLLTISQLNKESNHPCRNFYDDRRILVQSSQVVARATNYLLAHQRATGGWGSITLTSQVVIALRLGSGINVARMVNSSSAVSSLSIDEYYVSVIKNDMYQANSSITPGQLAYIVMALHAMCKDTSQFFGMNLNQKLMNNLEDYPSKNFNHPYAYSLTLLSLCLTNSKYKSNLVHKLQVMQSSDGTWADLDTTALAILALNCADSSSNSAISKGIQALLSKQSKTTYQFGNEYTTAHAVQAMLSQRIPISKWNYMKVLQELMKYEIANEGFGRIDNTAAVLPSLASAVYLDLKTVTCDEPNASTESRIITIVYTVRYQCLPYVNRTDEKSVAVASKADSPMLTFMRAAEVINPAYRFTVKYHATFSAYTVEKINNISSQTSNQLCHWFLQDDVTNHEIMLGVSHYMPQNNAKIAFIYRRP